MSQGSWTISSRRAADAGCADESPPHPRPNHVTLRVANRPHRVPWCLMEWNGTSTGRLTRVNRPGLRKIKGMSGPSLSFVVRTGNREP